MEKMMTLGEEGGKAMDASMKALPAALLEKLNNVPEFAPYAGEFQRLMSEAGEDPDFEAVMEKALPNFDEMPKEGRERILGAVSDAFKDAIGSALMPVGTAAGLTQDEVEMYVNYTAKM